MSPNPNYLRGRRFEYERRAAWMKLGYGVIRASGSHGEFDLVAYRPDKPVELIQCKLTGEVSTATLMLKRFKEEPPQVPSKFFHQVLEVKVKGSNAIFSATI